MNTATLQETQALQAVAAAARRAESRRLRDAGSSSQGEARSLLVRGSAPVAASARWRRAGFQRGWVGRRASKPPMGRLAGRYRDLCA